MPSQKVKSILQQFRTRFQDPEQVDIPLSLRQESPDILFTSLLEEDENPMAGPTPLMGYQAAGNEPALTGGEDPAMMVESLLGASREPEQGAPTPPATVDPQPQQAEAGPDPMAMPDLDAVLGMM